MVAQYSGETALAREEIEIARELLPKVEIPADVLEAGTQLVQRLGIDSLRAEITLFEAARAYSAADGRTQVKLDDLAEVAPMALRLRQSAFMIQYFNDQNIQEEHLRAILNQVAPTPRTNPAPEDKNYGD
jgi:magnesium chelatase subunit I